MGRQQKMKSFGAADNSEPRITSSSGLTFYLAVLSCCIAISNPNTYICDPSSPPSDPLSLLSIESNQFESSSDSPSFMNDSSSLCSILLIKNDLNIISSIQQRQHEQQQQLQQQQQTKEETEKDDIPFTNNDTQCSIPSPFSKSTPPPLTTQTFAKYTQYLHRNENQPFLVHYNKNNRYHTYYHYDLAEIRKMSYFDYVHHVINEIEIWWNNFSFLTIWKHIPRSWKLTTILIGITDTFFILIIKYLIFEDNYAF